MFSKFLVIIILSVIWVACGAQACVTFYTAWLIFRWTLSDRPMERNRTDPGGGERTVRLARWHRKPLARPLKTNKSLVSLDSVWLDSVWLPVMSYFLILVCFTSQWTLILYGLSSTVLQNFYAIENGKLNEPLNFKLIYYTIKLYLGGIWLSFLRGPKGWALKITCFHLWMFPQCLWAHLWDWIWSVF